MPKILQKKFCSAYFCLHYAVFSPFGKHFAWIFALFFDIMKEKQKIYKNRQPTKKSYHSQKVKMIGYFQLLQFRITHYEFWINILLLLCNLYEEYREPCGYLVFQNILNYKGIPQVFISGNTDLSHIGSVCSDPASGAEALDFVARSLDILTSILSVSFSVLSLSFFRFLFNSSKPFIFKELIVNNPYTL